MTRVILESPFAGATAKARRENIAYGRACLRDSLMRGEAPLASHLLYTQDGVLDDAYPAERARGIAAGLAWLTGADASVVYIDRGVSPGMKQGIEAASAAGVPVILRKLGQPDEDYVILPKRAVEAADA